MADIIFAVNALEKTERWREGSHIYSFSHPMSGILTWDYCTKNEVSH